jgi:NADH:ubiquinone oxidoreductase subunit C
MADDTAREEDHEAEAAGDVAESVSIPDDVAAAVVARFPGSVFVDSHGQAVVYVDREDIADVARMLRDDEQFTMLIDTVVVDHFVDGARPLVAGIVPERFEVVVNFLSHTRNRRIRLICQVPESHPTAPSLTPIYPGANFPERESYDLFGIAFEGHPDLTRILMPDDWHGYPLRKDDAPARVPVTFKGDPSPR